MQQLLAAVRRACLPHVWSRGVQLHRGGLVLGQHRRSDEIEVRVGSQGQAPRTYVVSLYVEDEDWSCDCDNREGDACAHVAAALIALTQAAKGQGAAPPPTAALPHVHYALLRTEAGLACERFVGVAGQRLAVPATLALLHRSGKAPAGLSPTRSDRLADGLLYRQPGMPLSSKDLHTLLQLLLDCPHVTLDEAPVRIGEARAALQVQVRGGAQRPWVQVVQDPAVAEFFANGAVLCGKQIHAVLPLQLPTARLQALRRGVQVAPADLAEFWNAELPALRRQLPVVMSTMQPPTLVDLPPQLQVRTYAQPNPEVPGFVVEASVVYMDPGPPPRVAARVEGERLVAFGQVLPRRNSQGEAGTEAQAEALGLPLGRRRLVQGREAVVLADRLQRQQLLQGAEGQLAAQMCSERTLVPACDLSAERFALQFRLPHGSTAGADANAVLQAWQNDEAAVRLLDGSFAPLPQAWLAQHGALVTELLAARDAEQRLTPALRLVAAHALEMAPDSQDDAIARLLAEDPGAAAPATLPQALQGRLRSYQSHGARWLQLLQQAQVGALLADDMGLGKTVQALAVLQPGRAALIVAPTSVVSNWAAEMGKFRPDLSFATYHGTQRQLQGDVDVVLTTYAILRRDQQALQARHWQVVVLDEAHTIKNPDSQVAGAALGLRADFRLALTGTPLENRFSELWSLFQFINPGLLGSQSSFAERFAAPIVAGEPGAAARLQMRLRPFVLRRLKQEVATELPARTEVVLRCTLGPAQRRLYEAIRAAMVPAVLRQLQAQGNVMQALEALLRLRQACCHPALIPGGHPEAAAEGSAKLELLLEILAQAVAEGHKALIFSQWTSLLDLVEPSLRAAGIAYVRLDGTTRDRGGVVSAFQAEGGPPVLLISLKAGGTGLNLTAADHVFLLDPWWNPAVEDQAADRAHRMGQTRPVLIHRLIAADTVEERIIDLQAHKRGLAQAALAGLDSAAPLSRHELARLLS